MSVLGRVSAGSVADLSRSIRCQFPARVRDTLPALFAEPLANRSVADAQLAGVAPRMTVKRKAPLGPPLLSRMPIGSRSVPVRDRSPGHLNRSRPLCTGVVSTEEVDDRRPDLIRVRDRSSVPKTGQFDVLRF